MTQNKSNYMDYLIKNFIEYLHAYNELYIEGIFSNHLKIDTHINRHKTQASYMHFFKFIFLTIFINDKNLLKNDKNKCIPAFSGFMN